MSDYIIEVLSDSGASSATVKTSTVVEVLLNVGPQGVPGEVTDLQVDNKIDAQHALDDNLYVSQAGGISAIAQVTQAAYNALTPVEGTLYIIVEGGSATLAMASSYVRFTTSGATFSPTVELIAGSTATVTWAVEGGATVTGISPTIDFGSVATRNVRMTVTKAGINAINEVVTLNLGFNNADDAGWYQVGAGYNKATQLVTGIENVRLMTGLKRFMAAHTPLTGALNFTGCSVLEFIEVFDARVTSFVLQGCTSLIRLCAESNSLTDLDLNPVSGNLQDLRSAVQQGGTITFAPLASPLAALYHLCIRDQTVVNHPTAAQLPVVVERWDWNTGQIGAFVSTSSELYSLAASDNSYTTADLTNQYPAGRGGVIQLSGNDLTSIILTGCEGVDTIILNGNNMAQAAVDSVLTVVNSWGTPNGSLNISANAIASSAGAAQAAALEARGWSVSRELPAMPGVDSDTFTRADATGLAAIGNGWHSFNSATANIVSNDLVRTDSNNYRILLNAASTVLPANYTVTMTIAGATVGNFIGLVGRWDNATQNGVRVMTTTSPNLIEAGDAGGYGYNNVTVPALNWPASWSNTEIDHTFAMKMTGSQIQVYADGQLVTTVVVTTNQAMTGTEYGICGEGNNRVWRSIGVTIP